MTQTTLQPAATMPRDGSRFLGLILAEAEGEAVWWEAIELLQWQGDQLFNLNSGNYTTIGRHLTHWLPEPLTP